jgi:hypothetical protein
MRTRAIVTAAGIGVAAATGAWAHHAMEFIETESYSTSRKGEGLFHLHYDYYSEDKNDPALDHWEFTPGLAYGFTDRFMGDVHIHYASFEKGLLVEEQQAEFGEEGPSPFLEAVALTLQYRVTEGAPVEVGVAGTFEQPFDRAEELLGSDQVFEGTLILARGFGNHGNVTLNLIAGIEDEEDYQEFALGVKYPLAGDAHGITAGVEFLGDLEDVEETWSILPGIYLPLGGEQTLLKTGVEVGHDMDYTRANITLMHRF